MVRPVIAILLTLAGWTGALADEPRVRVLALFPGKAMLEIDGRERILRAGQASPEGVRLVTADQHEAVVEVGGRREALTFGTAVGGSFATPATREVKIYRNPKGAYTTAGSINGRPVDFMVDTGATRTALPAALAGPAGLQPQGTIRSDTAGGEVQGQVARATIELDGGVRAERLPVALLPVLSTPLLGMDVLSRMRFSQSDGVLRLEPAAGSAP